MNAQERLKQKEQISALTDGQLGDLEFAATFEWVVADDEARASWHAYHLVGDVLRSGELAAWGRDRDFLARLNSRLQTEPVARWRDVGGHGAPESIALKDPAVPTRARNLHESGGVAPAANDGIFRWKLVAGFASLAAVAALGWSAIGSLESVPGGARLAQSGGTPGTVAQPVPGPDASPAVAAGPPVMIRDPRLDEFMAAHRQFGGTSALQNPSGFLRNATFEGGSR